MAARIGPEWVDVVRRHALEVDTGDVRAAYRRRDIPRADGVRDIERRHRWDVWYAVPCDVRYALEDEHPGLTIEHIDTMLRQAVAPLS